MRKPLAVLLSLLFAASLAACSDDDDPGSGSGSGSGTEEPASGSGSESDDTTTTAGDEGDDATTTTGGEGDEGDDTPGEASSEYCATADRFVSDESLANLDMTNPDDVAIGVALLEDLRDAAPDEIQDDVQIIIDVFQEVSAAAAEAGDDPDAQAALAEEFADDLEALDAATTVLTDFTLDACGIDITGGGATGTP